MKNIPKKIFLQIDPEKENFKDFYEASLGDITWCPDKIYKNDVEYIRRDAIFEFIEPLDLPEKLIVGIDFD